MSQELFKTNESLEMYIETIYLLSLQNPCVKMSDVATNLGVSKPSCHTAMKHLKEKQLIIQEKYGDIKLTIEGIHLGKSIYDKHQLITQFLIKALDLDDKVAEIDACRMEHVLSDITLEAIEKWVNKRN